MGFPTPFSLNINFSSWECFSIKASHGGRRGTKGSHWLSFLHCTAELLLIVFSATRVWLSKGQKVYGFFLNVTKVLAPHTLFDKTSCSWCIYRTRGMDISSYIKLSVFIPVTNQAITCRFQDRLSDGFPRSSTHLCCTCLEIKVNFPLGNLLPFWFCIKCMWKRALELRWVRS